MGGVSKPTFILKAESQKGSIFFILQCNLTKLNDDVFVFFLYRKYRGCLTIRVTTIFTKGVYLGNLCCLLSCLRHHFLPRILSSHLVHCVCHLPCVATCWATQGLWEFSFAHSWKQMMQLSSCYSGQPWYSISQHVLQLRMWEVKYSLSEHLHIFRQLSCCINGKTYTVHWI